MSKTLSLLKKIEEKVNSSNLQKQAVRINNYAYSLGLGFRIFFALFLLLNIAVLFMAYRNSSKMNYLTKTAKANSQEITSFVASLDNVEATTHTLDKRIPDSAGLDERLEGINREIIALKEESRIKALYLKTFVDEKSKLMARVDALEDKLNKLKRVRR